MTAGAPLRPRRGPPGKARPPQPVPEPVPDQGLPIHGLLCGTHQLQHLGRRGMGRQVQALLLSHPLGEMHMVVPESRDEEPSSQAVRLSTGSLLGPGPKDVDDDAVLDHHIEGSVPVEQPGVGEHQRSRHSVLSGSVVRAGPRGQSEGDFPEKVSRVVRGHRSQIHRGDHSLLIPVHPDATRKTRGLLLVICERLPSKTFTSTLGFVHM